MQRPINVNGVQACFNLITLFIIIGTMTALLLTTNKADANINPHYVSRSQFTTAINNREPADHLKQLPTNLAVVYYFAELKNLKGRRVTFQWSNNSRDLGKAQFSIGGNRWRLNTKKSVPSGTLFIRLTLDDGTVLLTDSIASRSAQKLTTQSTKTTAQSQKTPQKPSSNNHKTNTQQKTAIDPALKALLGDDIDQATIDQLLNNNTPTQSVDVINDSPPNKTTEAPLVDAPTAINTATTEESISNQPSHKNKLTNASANDQQGNLKVSKPPVFVGPTKPESHSTNTITSIQPSSPNSATRQSQPAKPVPVKKEKKSHTLVPQSITPEEAIKKAIDRGLADKDLNSLEPLKPNITARQPTRQLTSDQNKQQPIITIKQDSEKPKTKLIKLD